VALVIANTGLIDTRVVKYVTSLADAGYQVRVLCHSPDGARHEIDRYGACFVQLPTPPPTGAADRAAEHVRAVLVRVGRVTRRLADRVILRWRPEPPGSGLGSPLRRTELAVYTRVPALARWRRVCRVSVAREPVLAAELDAFAPDVVHQHDVHELNATAAWVTRRRAAGDRVGFVYDAREYVIGQPNPPARQVAAYAGMERELIGAADRVITVCDPIADQLVLDYRLLRRPTVVMNATWAADDPHSGHPVDPATVRAATGLADDVPLLVYAGGLAPARGVHTVVAALGQLPGVHLAVVSRAESSYTRQLREVAGQHGVADRLHLVPFVEPEQVVAYLTGCDLGVSPLLHAPNHDWALTNKFFEYVQAGLPVITSDTPVQAELVDALGIGSVFRAGDVADCAAAIRTGLDQRVALRAVVADPGLRRRLSWAHQAEALLELYRELLPAEHAPGRVTQPQPGRARPVTRSAG
jgi:glycosyltransferase involved in cell wall biosynthesis